MTKPLPPHQLKLPIHGMRYSPEYRTWRGMKYRCVSKEKAHRRYRELGIKVCDEWMNDFPAFYLHVGPKPSPEHTLDRIDNNGNYEPGNVRWATSEEQSVNRECTRRATYKGKTLALSRWARELGINFHTLAYRQRVGWTSEQIFETPTGRSNTERVKKLNRKSTAIAGAKP